MERNLYPLKGSRNSGLVLHWLHVSITSGAAINVDDNPLLGTWTKQATGVYRWVSKDTYTAPALNGSGVFLQAWPVFEAATSVDLVPQIKTKSVSAGVITLDVALMTGGTATDPAAACSIGVLLLVKDSQAKP